LSSSPQNPGLEREEVPGPLEASSRTPTVENPPWTGWDVLRIVVVTLVAILVSLLAVAYAAQQLLLPRKDFAEVARSPLVTVAAQLLAYIVVLVFMVSIVARERELEFWQAVRWNWPARWPSFLLGGVALSVALQGLAHLLPMPKEMPIDRFFSTPLEAWVVSLFGISIAPLVEELFFRGFLYPVLVRRVGSVLAIALTSAAFGLIHSPQLGHAWGPILVVFLIGLAITITRAATKSVAAGLLMHIAYNGTLSILIFITSGGFRHLSNL
jgi:membrane protease YdiL (CAAX protease family)